MVLLDHSGPARLHDTPQFHPAWSAASAPSETRRIYDRMLLSVFELPGGNSSGPKEAAITKVKLWPQTKQIKILENFDVDFTYVILII